MPELTYKFKADTSQAIEALNDLARRSAALRRYEPIKTEALTEALVRVGMDDAWFDYLSPGDSVRAVRLYIVLRDESMPEGARSAAYTAIAELRRVAEERATQATS